MPARFAPRLLPTLAALAGVVAFALLGQWQLGRAHEKEARAAVLAQAHTEPPRRIGATQVDAHAIELHPVVARGVWQPERAVFVDNRSYRGQAGYHVLMPLALEGGTMHVLVNRGWMPLPARRDIVPEPPTPAGEIEVSGVARVPSSHPFELAHEGSTARIWQNLTLQRFRDWSKLALQPVVIEQSGGPDDGLVRDWPAADSGAAKNRGYAFQWYALALLCAGLWLRYSWTRTA